MPGCPRMTLMRGDASSNHGANCCTACSHASGWCGFAPTLGMPTGESPTQQLTALPHATSVVAHDPHHCRLLDDLTGTWALSTEYACWRRGFSSRASGIPGHARVGRGGDQDGVSRFRRLEPMAAHQPARSAIGVLHRLQPGQAQCDGRPARTTGSRGLPATGGTR